VEFGVSLSSEEHAGRSLVDQAARAEEAGFRFALISDHFHPWLDQQGNSPFVWSTLGAIAQATQRLRVGTGVTCPLIRIHPAIVAQAAASTQELFGGRFFLGLGTGENLNEHILGDGWPRPSVRLAMLEEAVALIRHLWAGGLKSWSGDYYEVDRARIYTLPQPLPPIYLAAVGKKAAELAGRVGDGLISTAPKGELVRSFQTSGGGSKPRYGQATVCWAPSEREATQLIMRWWPIIGIGGELDAELPTPRDFESAVSTVRPEDVAGKAALGPDPERHVELIRKYAEAGFDHVYIHQVGPDQAGFLRFYRDEVIPELTALRTQASA
jgi:coenzyme F420-dependent glucose-6-phosphate dehydrogenase